MYIVVCEPIPSDRASLKTASNYHHFRTIYAAQRILNNLLQESDSPAEVKLVMANHSADIPKHFRRHAGAVCCVIFGPNLPRLNEATVRIASNSHRQRQVVVCYNPDQVNFTWDQLEDLGTRMSITGCRAEADKNEIRQFWTRYFTEVLKPLVESHIESPESEDRASADKQLTAEEIRELLAKDPTAVDMLPGFPHICRQVIEAIDQGKAYAQVAEIIQPDGALQASIVRTSNLARYASRNRIETLPNALTMIGMEETKRIVMGRAMSDLMKKVDQAGFDTRDFFLPQHLRRLLEPAPVPQSGNSHSEGARDSPEPATAQLRGSGVEGTPLLGTLSRGSRVRCFYCRHPPRYRHDPQHGLLR